MGIFCITLSNTETDKKLLGEAKTQFKNYLQDVPLPPATFLSPFTDAISGNGTKQTVALGKLSNVFSRVLTDTGQSLEDCIKRNSFWEKVVNEWDNTNNIKENEIQQKLKSVLNKKRTRESFTGKKGKLTTAQEAKKPDQNPHKLYIFGESAQALSAKIDLLDSKKQSDQHGLYDGIKDKLRQVAPNKEAAELVAATGQASVRGYRATHQGKKHIILNDNAIGLVLKKNQQKDDGAWITQQTVEESDLFTEDDLELFKEINTPIIAAIARLVKSDKYTEVNMPTDFALLREGLPKPLAEWLAQELRNKLNVLVTVERSKFLSSTKAQLWGIKVHDTVTWYGREKNEKLNENKSKGKESLRVSRPSMSSMGLQIQDIDIIQRSFNSIQDQKIAIDFMGDVFSGALDAAIRSITINLQQSVKKLSSDDKDLLYILTKKDRYERRKAVFKYKKIGLPTIKGFILSKFKKYVGELPVDLHKIPKDTLNELYEKIYTNNNLFINISPASLKASRSKKDSHIIKMLTIMRETIDNEKLFDALLLAGTERMERVERLMFTEDMQTMQEVDNDEQEKDLETQGNARADLGIVKMKEVNPKDSLSTRMRDLLASLFQVSSAHKDSRGYYHHNFTASSLGLKMYLDSGVVYMQLQKQLQYAKDERHFMYILETMAKTNPWVYQLIEKLEKDSDLLHEFFSNFFRKQMLMSVITPRGMLQFKNMGLDALAVLDMVTKNFEGGVTMSDTSIYNGDSKLNLPNIRKLKALIKPTDNDLDPTGKKFVKNQRETPTEKKERNLKRKNVIREKAPLKYALDVLTTFDNTHDFDELELATEILLGVHKSEKDSNGALIHPQDQYSTLDNLLLSIGIDTTGLHLDRLLPPINSEGWQRLNGVEPHKLKEAINNLWDKDTRDKLLKILDISSRLLESLKDENNRSIDIVSSYQSMYVALSGSLVGISEQYTQSSTHLNGTTRYSFVAHDFATILTNHLNASDYDANPKDTYIKRNYLRYDLFKDLEFFKRLDVDELTRQQFNKTMVLESKIGIDAGTSKAASKNEIKNLSDKRFLATLIAGYYRANSVSSDSQYAEDGERCHFGYYRNPLYSDVDKLELYRLPRYHNDYKDKVIGDLIQLLKAEIDRINASRAKKTGVKVDNYNKGENNAERFNFFPKLNKDKEEILQKVTSIANPTELTNYLHRLVEEYLEQGYSEFAKIFTEEDYIKLGRMLNQQQSEKFKQEIVNFSLTEEFDEESQQAKKSQNEEERQSMLKSGTEKAKEFYYNDFLAQANLILLLGGDLAYYKDIRDFIKRNKQCYAGGNRIWAIDENGNELQERVMILEDIEETSNTIAEIQTILKDFNPTSTKQRLVQSGTSQMEAELIAGSLRSLGSITATDGQAFRTLKSFKTILQNLGGKWTEEIEESFQRIEQGNINIEDFNVLIDAIKPFMFTYETQEISGRTEKIPVQHKNSEYLLTALYTTLHTSLNNSPILKGLMKFMDTHNIDAIQFHSCVKVGAHSIFDLSCDPDKLPWDYTSYEAYRKRLTNDVLNKEITQEQFNTLIKEVQIQDEDRVVQILESQLNTMGEQHAIHSHPLRDLMIIQPTKEHLVDTEALIGTQGKNIIFSDYTDAFNMVLRVGNKSRTLNYEEAQKLYNTILADQVIDTFIKLKKGLGDIGNTQKLLQTAMQGNPKYGPEVRKIFVLKDKTAFKLNLATPSIKNTAQDILLSQAKKIQRQDIKGGAAVLVSNFSLSDSLKVQYTYKKDGDGNEILDAQGQKIPDTVDYIPAYMPAHFKDLYKDFLIKKTDGGVTYFEVDMDKVKRQGAEKLFELIGYRIPTEAKYSLMPIRVVGFLPIQAGGTIMLPSDIVALSGTDFKQYWSL